MRRIARYAMAVIAAHVIVMTWHLSIASAPGALAIAGAINMLPVLAVILSWRGSGRTGGALLAIPMAAVFLFGGFMHFLGAGPDNVFHLGAQFPAAAFRASVLAMVALQLLAIWIGVRAWRAGHSGAHAHAP